MSEKTMARVLKGTVISDSMDKSITVKVERFVKHPKYGKFVRKSTKIMAHDENNEARVGDKVSIQECRPLSKHKSFALNNIDERAIVD